jgi:hypothetical protein
MEFSLVLDSRHRASTLVTYANAKPAPAVLTTNLSFIQVSSYLICYQDSFIHFIVPSINLCT